MATKTEIEAEKPYQLYICPIRLIILRYILDLCNYFPPDVEVIKFSEHQLAQETKDKFTDAITTLVVSLSPLSLLRRGVGGEVLSQLVCFHLSKTSLNTSSSIQVFATTAKGSAMTNPKAPKKPAKKSCAVRVKAGNSDTCLAMTVGVNQ